MKSVLELAEFSTAFVLLRGNSTLVSNTGSRENFRSRVTVHRLNPDVRQRSPFCQSAVSALVVAIHLFAYTQYKITTSCFSGTASDSNFIFIHLVDRETYYHS